VKLLETGPPDAPVRLMLAHGAGGAMDSPFMEAMARLLGDGGLGVTRFEFSYMASRRAGGKRRPPPRAEALLDEYEAVVREVSRHAGGARLLIGGKSMGGRVASMLAARLHAERLIAGLVCLGYPFHPPAKPEQVRIAHLEVLDCPALIVQGDRDPFGSRNEIAKLGLSGAIEIAWIPDGDHDLGPRGGSGHTRRGNLALAADRIRQFAARV
jgi:predicted alpha/beta-hydrolase family hydrolase